MRPMVSSGSPSISTPEYWWYRARADLLHVALGRYAGQVERCLDVGSADGPSVDWLRRSGPRVALDMDPRGLQPGDVCGSALQLPFADECFDVVAAFDVIEHCEPEQLALAEISRVLRPGGRLLMSVPAYEWAWTHHDDLNHHHRRYTRRRAVQAVVNQGFEVERASYMFASTFPMFAVSRLVERWRQRNVPPPDLGPEGVPPLPEVGAVAERVLLGASRAESRALRRWDLPFGSSVVVAARKPEAVAPRAATRHAAKEGAVG